MRSGVVSAVLSAIVMAVSYPLYLRYLGYGQYGVWLVLTTIISLTQLGNLGLSQALTMRLAVDWANGNKKGMRTSLSNSFLLLSVAGMIIFAGLVTSAAAILRALRLPNEYLHVATVLFPWVVALSVYTFFVDAGFAALSGIGRIDLANYGQLLNQLIAALLSLYLLAHGHGLPALLLSTAASYVAVHVAAVTVFWLSTGVSPVWPAAISRAALRELSSAGTQLMAGSVLAVLVNPLSKLLLSRYGAINMVPVYDIAFNAAMRLRSVFELAQRALLPEIVRLRTLCTASCSAEISLLYKRSIRLVLWCIPLYAAAWIFVTPALQIWLGARYQPALSGALRIMLFGTYCSLLGTPAFYTLMGLQRLNSIVVSNFIQFSLSVGAILVLGYSGVAIRPDVVVWATAAGMLASTTYLLVKYRQVANIALAAGLATS